MRYKKLAEQIIDEIREEAWQQGARLPSLRKAAALYEVSITTATNCYQFLEDAGWITARPQSGFYVTSPMEEGQAPRLPHFQSHVAPTTGSVEYLEQVENAFASSPLGISRLADDYLPLDGLQRALKRGLQQLEGGLGAYPDPRGDAHLRTALAHHFQKNGLKVPSEELVVTGGCIDAVRTALEVTTVAGDAVAISSPCFSGLLQLLRSLGRRIVEIPCTHDGIDIPQLEAHLGKGEVKAVLLSTSHMNPQGISLSTGQKKALAALATRYRTPFIEDDVYVEFAFNNKKSLPAKVWDREGYVIWCSSVSKSLAASLRVGWCWPGRYLRAYQRMYGMGCLGTSAVTQRGLAAFIASGQYEKHLRQARARLFAQICAYRALLLKHLPRGCGVSRPDGGLVLWVQVPGLDAEPFEKACKLEGLDIRLGKVFSTRNIYQEYFRLNCGWALQDRFDENRTLAEAVVRVCEIAAKYSE